MSVLSRGCAAIVLSALCGCASNVTTAPEGAPISLVINEVKRQVAEIGQYYVTDPATPTECKATVKAVPETATITLKETVNTTYSGSGSGNIPIGFVIVSPSISGAYSKIQTQVVTLNVGIVKSDLPSARTTLTTTRAPTEAVPLTQSGDQPTPGLKDIVLSAVQGLLHADHMQKPCLQPRDLKVQADFQVTKKADGGVQINFIVAKIGSDVARTDDVTQSVAVTLTLEGSSAIK